MPFIDNVIYIDKRILDLEAPAQEVIASDQKRLVVDAFARYRIKDPLRFYQTLGSIGGANSQLAILLNSALRRVLGEATFIARRARPARRADGSASASWSTARRRATASRWSTCASAAPICRSRTARRSISACRPSASARRRNSARKARSAGRKSARAPIARSPCWSRKRQSKSEQIRGEGDATRNQIFADAFSQDPDFFAFYRSMQAYETGLKANDTRLVLKPDSSFFRFFNDPIGQAAGGRGRRPAPGAPAPAR